MLKADSIQLNPTGMTIALGGLPPWLGPHFV